MLSSLFKKKIQRYSATEGEKIITHYFSSQMRQLCHVSGSLLQYRLRVATTSDEKQEKSWNEPETVVTLHQKSEMISLFDLLTQTKHKGVIISTLCAYHISLRPD